MKTPPMKAKSAKMGHPPTRKMSSKPRIRMQKIKPVAASAFPAAAAAFPPDGGPAGPDQAMAGQPAGLPSGAAPGSMGE